MDTHLLESVSERLDAAATDTEVVRLTREVSSTRRQAETAVLLLAAQWADAHPVLEDGRPLFGPSGRSQGVDDAGGYAEDRGIPLVDRLSVSSFAVALGRSTAAADVLLRDVAVLRHRMPAIWRLAGSGLVEAWRARRVARLVVGAPDDVCAHLDTVLAPIVATVGERTLERLLDQAMLAHDPEQHEQDQLDAMAARFVTLDRDSVSADGLVDLAIRADLKDAYDFDTAVAQIAEALAALDEAAGREVEPLDVRRARAIGVLADPEQAADLLARPVAEDGEDGGKNAPARRRGRLRKRLQLVVHLAADGYTMGPMGIGPTGWVPVSYDQTHHQSVLTQLVADWAGRTDTHLTILPVLDLVDHRAVAGYRPGTTLTRQIQLKRGTCSFPLCSRPATACDMDHVVAFNHDDPDDGGATCPCNLAPPLSPAPQRQDPRRLDLHHPRGRHLAVDRPARPGPPRHPTRHPRPDPTPAPRRREAETTSDPRTTRLPSHRGAL